MEQIRLSSLFIVSQYSVPSLRSVRKEKLKRAIIAMEEVKLSPVTNEEILVLKTLIMTQIIFIFEKQFYQNRKIQNYHTTSRFLIFQ